MISFTVGSFVNMSVNLITNSNKLTSPITVVGRKIVCVQNDFSMIKELLKRNSINTKVVA